MRRLASLNLTSHSIGALRTLKPFSMHSNEIPYMYCSACAQPVLQLYNGLVFAVLNVVFAVINGVLLHQQPRANGPV